MFGSGVLRLFKDEGRRRFVRALPLAADPVEVQIMGSEVLDVIHADDISVGGLAFHLPFSYSESELAEEVQLVIKLPGHTSFLAHAVIRNISRGSAKARYGLEFTELNDANRRAIADYVEKLLEAGRKA